MIRRRRNLRDYVNNENGERQRDFSKKEIRVYAYYLFHIFEYFKKKLRINGDDGLYHSFIKLLHHLIIRSDVNDSVSAYLIQTISKAEEAKKLTPKDSETERYFYGDNIQIKYKEDNKISSLIYGDSEIDDLYINIQQSFHLPAIARIHTSQLRKFHINDMIQCLFNQHIIIYRIRQIKGIITIFQILMKILQRTTLFIDFGRKFFR